MRNNVKRLAACVVVGVAVFANCQKRSIEPVAIAAEYMCSYCRMAISEKQYAAEFIDTEGNAFKFDDIGCMVNFLKNKKNSVNPAAYFVMDFESRRWLKAETAVYVRSSEVSTPMNGGIIAFHDQTQAQSAADKYHGTRFGFDKLLGK